MYSSLCTPEDPLAPQWGSTYTHVRVRLVLQWSWEAYHQNHNYLGFLAII
jgi:hypothetical protein